MATYQEQIENNKENKHQRNVQLMTDLAILSKVFEAAQFLERENLMTRSDTIAMLNKYIDAHPDIKKFQEGRI